MDNNRIIVGEKIVTSIINAKTFQIEKKIKENLFRITSFAGLDETGYFVCANKIGNIFYMESDFGNIKCVDKIEKATNGTVIMVANIGNGLFASVEKNKAMDYIMHELFHVLSNTGRFPELDVVSRKLLNIVSKGVEKENITEFLTGKKQNIHSDWRGELINYLCNNSFKWELAMKEVKEAYKEILEESGLFNMNSVWWKKRFPLTKKE